MIYDRAFSNYSRIWQREITEMEHDVAMEDYTDADAYTASLVPPHTPASLPLVAAIPTQEAAGADEDRLPTRPMGHFYEETLLNAPLAAYAIAMLGCSEACE